MYHERTVSGGSPYVTRPAGRRVGRGRAAGPARWRPGRSGHGPSRRAATRELIGEVQRWSGRDRAHASASRTGIRYGTHDGPGGGHHPALRRDLVGAHVVDRVRARRATRGRLGTTRTISARPASLYLMRQAACIGGGTTEMSRNVISVVLRLLVDPDKYPGTPPVLRSYSLSDLPAAGHFRISVKNELNGIGSSFLCNRARQGDLLDVSAPRGSFTLRPGQSPVVLLSAGVAQLP